MRPVDPEVLSWLPDGRRWLLETGLLALARAGAVVAQALLLAAVLVRAFEGEQLSPALPALVLVVVLRAGLHGLSERSSRTASVRLRTALRRRLTRRGVELGPVWLSGPGAKGFTTLVTEGVDSLDGYLGSYVPAVASAAVVPPAVLLAVGLEDWRSLLVLLATLPLLPLFLGLVGLHTRQQTQDQYAGLARLTDHFRDVVVGLPTLTAFGRADRQADVLRGLAGAHRKRTVRVLRTAFLSALALELLATLSVAVVAVFLGFRLLDGHVGFLPALTVLLLAPEAFAPVRALGSAFHAGSGGLAAADAAKEVLALPVRGTAGTAALPARRDLVLDDVTVAYDDGTRALHGVTLEVAEGECVAVMGDSGAGKSTLLLALMGLVPACAGRVLVGGQDLDEFDGEAWRRSLAWVPQRPWLLAGSLRDNLLLGNEGASEDALGRAVRDARVDEFLDELPQGLDTLVGERGLGLSLGQLRRVALARALLRDAPVLLLDEPTADLDLRSECEVVAALRTVARGRTVVVTTHRAAPFVGWTRSVRLAALALASPA